MGGATVAAAVLLTCSGATDAGSAAHHLVAIDGRATMLDGIQATVSKTEVEYFVVDHWVASATPILAHWIEVDRITGGYTAYFGDPGGRVVTDRGRCTVAKQQF